MTGRTVSSRAPAVGPARTAGGGSADFREHIPRPGRFLPCPPRRARPGLRGGGSADLREHVPRGGDRPGPELAGRDGPVAARYGVIEPAELRDDQRVAE